MMIFYIYTKEKKHDDVGENLNSPLLPTQGEWPVLLILSRPPAYIPNAHAEEQLRLK